MNNYIQEAKKRIKKVREDRLLFLDLSCLHLDNIPEDISDMIYLLEIDVSHNNFKEFPLCLSKLTNLQTLNLSNNLLQDIHFIEGLYYSLQTLNISSNLLNHIPNDLFFINAEIIFEDNPFLDGLPIEILASNDLGYIDFYFDQLRSRDATEKLFESKLLIVGKGNVGKTTLMKVLANKKYKVKVGKEKTTHGINVQTVKKNILFPAKKPYYDHFSNIQNLYFQILDSDFDIDDDDNNLSIPKNVLRYYHISELDLSEDTLLQLRLEQQPFFIDNNIYFEKEIIINIWDFGGQEILYSTHQFFLTQRSIYLLIWEPRSDDEIESFEYWLNTIKRLSNNSPVIIVMNKADIRVKLIDEEYYKRRFSNIVSFLEISCLNKSGLENLNTEIESVILNLPHIGDSLPKSWDRIRRELKESSQDYLNLDEFKKICNSSNKKDIAYISRYLNDLGVIIHFQSDFYLKNLIVINPEWLTNAIYLLINSIKVQKNNGLFSADILEELFDNSNYPYDKFFDIILLMEKFEICYKILGSPQEYIIPTLLPPYPNDYKLIDNFLNEMNSLQYKIHYNFMPSGVIERLICRLNNYIKGNNIWKYGMILNTENSEALIISDVHNRELKVYVKGSLVTPLFNIIEHEIKEIHTDIKIAETDTNEYLACNCNECSHSSSPYLFKRATLINFLKKDKEYIYCQQSTEQVDIKNMMIGYRSDENSKKDLLRKLISTGSTLQTRYNQIKDFNEDEINIYFQDIFRAHIIKSNYFLNEQSLRGKSSSGKKAGELDFTIETLEGEMISFYEGFILKSMDRRNISTHIEKTLLKYDSNGLKEKYIGVYSKVEDFDLLTIKYLAYLNEIDLKNIVLDSNTDVSEIYLGSSEMKVFKTVYHRNNTKLFLYHIIINLNL
ncbi:COR domain-containing protein [Mesonia sp. K7]|uniref:COR domain-containing protein n=1 Tax=Mesonia sp. K7 TaxID=2218606 RepID=UPI000DA73745|nr:COR domain-containing protein [Mesonia sp. K7]PZD76642.1 hypothetical protein DNG35_11250 [Mesonia sp. K7]